MTDLIAAAKAALRDLERTHINHEMSDYLNDDISSVENDLRVTIKEADKVEPVAWRYKDSRGHYRYVGNFPKFNEKYQLLKPVPLYLHPASTTLSKETAQQQFDDCGGSEIADPIERLRFFCCLAMDGQDWLDVEPYFNALLTTTTEWKDHNTAQLMNELTEISVKYRDMQQLRERIAHVIRPLADTAKPIPHGYKLIAREPTEEMLDVVTVNHKKHPTVPDRWKGNMTRIFRAMWDAAPEVKS